MSTQLLMPLRFLNGWAAVAAAAGDLASQDDKTASSSDTHSATGGPGGPGDDDPGEWGKSRNNSKQERGRAYSEQVTGQPADRGYYINGVEFDGYEPSTRTAVDAKGPGYDKLLEPRALDKWSNAGQDALEQATRQSNAVKGTGVKIEWHVAEETSSIYFRNMMKENNLNIDVRYVPPK